MGEHTPGPWSEVKDSGPAATKTPEWWVYADDADYKLVAICQGPAAQANSSLVAEAPALLVTLEEELKWLENIKANGTDATAIRIGARTRANKVRAAIQAAKGATP